MSGKTLLAGNLAAVPRLAWLEGVVESTLIRLIAADDSSVLQVRTSRDQWVALHGRHDPLRDARRLIETARVPTHDAIVVLVGAAGGHVAEVLLEELHARHVLILEPHALSARTMLARRDWRPALDAGRLTLLVGPAYAGASDAWAGLDGVDDSRVRVIEDAVLAREHEPLVARARDVLERVRFDAAANRKAREDLGACYALQTLTNLPAVLQSPSLQTLAGRATGWPAVIVAAGPSLWRNLEGSGAWRDRVVVIAVDTTVRMALAHGLEPDYIVAVDPTNTNGRHLRGLGALARSWLVAEASIAPAALDVCGERRTFFRVADNIPWPWLVRHGLDLPRLAVWGSVLTAAYSLARHLSCASISLLGADLAFTDGQPYSRGVVFEREWARQRLEGVPLRQAWARQRRKRPVVEVPDVSGGRVLSAPHLLAFRDWLAEQSASDGIAVRNATGRGALIGPGITQINTSELATLPAPSVRFDPAPTGVGDASGQLAARLRTALAHDSRERDGLEAALARVASAEETTATLTNMATRLGATSRRAQVALPEAPLLSAAYPWLDERLVQWCAARAGRTPSWLQPTVGEADAEQRLQQADTLMAWLSRHGTLTDTSSTQTQALPLALPREVRLLIELPWRPDAEAAVLGLQALAAGEARARASLPGRWRTDGRATVVASSGALGPGAHRRQERAARLAAMALRTQLAICRAAERPDPALHVCAAVIDGCVPNASDEAFVVHARMAFPGAQLSVAGTIASTTLLSALEGALMRADATPPQPLTFRWTDGPALHAQVAIRPRRRASTTASLDCRMPCAWLRPRWLTDHGLPPSHAASPSSDGRYAVLTPRGARASVLVDSAGLSTPLREWPVALVAELQGPHWHVALSQEHDGHVCARATNDPTTVIGASITGVPYTAAWADDHRVLVTTSTGLWEWRPGTPARLVVDVPPAAIVDVTRDSVRLDPIPVLDGRHEPRRLSEGWRIDLVDSTVTRQALDAAGQAWGRTQRGDVIAIAHPESNLIRLDADNTSCWLAWHRPRGVVWLDEHLLIWGADGRIALVRDAWSTVTSALTGASPALQLAMHEGRES
ncbi:hypothetical protein LuPra_03615 [Luteitalea pratensis]|uniref:6-hydroxymethylpterin diphosphokinase MptE-like domain-containing protein n=1 Tax=Luteitalea pratensis TaxID=1855912 RepID=A0A143PP83_LUTPR|nr:hypothetical protein LuPra_03615 [Luteitalea pratensis]